MKHCHKFLGCMISIHCIRHHKKVLSAGKGKSEMADVRTARQLAVNSLSTLERLRTRVELVPVVSSMKILGNMLRYQVVTNILNNPDEPKFRRMRVQNKSWISLFHDCEGAYDMFRLLGFEQVEDEEEGICIKLPDVCMQTYQLYVTAYAHVVS